MELVQWGCSLRIFCEDRGIQRDTLGACLQGPAPLILSPVCFWHHLECCGMSWNGLKEFLEICLEWFGFFPTCQVRVVRFYQSCCPPPPPPVSPRPCLHQLPPPLPPCQLFAKLFANFLAQCTLLDLNLGPSQLSAHR